MFRGEDGVLSPRGDEAGVPSDLRAVNADPRELSELSRLSFLPITTRAYTSTSPARRSWHLATGEFIAEQIFNWTYTYNSGKAVFAQ